jgi:hypothetical protein
MDFGGILPLPASAAYDIFQRIQKHSDCVATETGHLVRRSLQFLDQSFHGPLNGRRIHSTPICESSLIRLPSVDPRPKTDATLTAAAQNHYY